MEPSKSKRRRRVFFLGLFLSSRCLQLSIDRARPKEWIELRNYLSKRVPIADLLSQISRASASSSLDLASPPPSPPAKKHKWRKKLTLKEVELNFVAWWLTKAGSVLADDDPQIDEVRDVRLHLAYCEDLLRSRLSWRDRKLSNVEHFNQNPILDCKSIEDLLGEAWPPE